MAQFFLYLIVGIGLVAYALMRRTLRAKQKNVFLGILASGAAIVMYLPLLKDPRIGRHAVDFITGTVMLIAACRRFKLAGRDPDVK